jgi:heat shock protein HslJ/uncharacterized membrane protein
MKLLYTTLSIAILLMACGPKDSDKKDKPDTLGLDSAKQAQILKDSINGESDPSTPNLLTARGSEPFWSLTMTKTTIKFKLADKDTVTASDYVVADNSNDQITYYTGGKDFGITVENKPTIDAATGKTYEKSISISFQGKKYKGVGGDIVSGDTKPATIETMPKPIKSERYTVNGEWVLATLNGKKATTRDFANGKATININTVDKRATGFGGCNRINGEVTIFEGTKIKFDKMISTKMFCEGVKENDYLTALRNATDFAIVGGNLQLKANGAMLATFIRPVE